MPPRPKRKHDTKRSLCHCSRCKGNVAQPGYTVRDHAKRYGLYKPTRAVRHDRAFDDLRARPFGRPRTPPVDHSQAITPVVAEAAATTTAAEVSVSTATGADHFADWGAGPEWEGMRWDAEEDGSETGAQDVEVPAGTGPGTLVVDRGNQVSSVPDAYRRLVWKFDVPVSAVDPSGVYAESGVQSLVLLLLLLVCWLHLFYHLGHRGTNLALHVICFIFKDTGIAMEGDEILTLVTAMHVLGLDDNFLVLPMCDNCGQVVPHDTPKDSKCAECSFALFASKARSGSSGRLDSPDNFRPIVKFPFHPISSQLAEILGREGMEALLDLWRLRDRRDGDLVDMMDGEIWKTLRAHDGSLFFDNSRGRRNSNELRIGLTLSMDGFSHNSSRSAGSHSSDVISCCIANLPPQFKCRPRNLLLCGLYPGPKAPTALQVQYVLKPLVDDLLRLYEDGIFIKTPLFPEGRLIRVVIVAICCDHPAMCKACGFADHGHSEAPCTKCKIDRESMTTAEGLIDEFEARTGDEHRRRAFEYVELDEKHCAAYFKVYGVRFTELARLPYLDLIRMTVIDPMHNILLGIVKCQWLTTWINGGALRERTSKKAVKRELDLILAYLKEFEMPSWVGCLPSQLGYAAGGSLSADELKALALVFLPVVIPFIWGEWQPSAQELYERKLREWEEKGGTDAERGPKPTPRMYADDSDNFLKLAAVLKVILARSVRAVDIPATRELLATYLQGYAKNHPEDVKPNFHWVIHIFDQIHDFGPVYGFWSFTIERLNKILKSYKTNNHGSGELEVTFMREFYRDVRLRKIVSCNARRSTADLRTQVVSRMILDSENDSRGTVSSLAKEIDEAARDMDGRISFGTTYTLNLDDATKNALIAYYKQTYPEITVLAHDCPEADACGTPNFLNNTAQHHKYIVFKGRRIVPSADIYSAPNAIVQTHIGVRSYVGQVIAAFTHRQNGIARATTLLHVKWFRELRPGILNTDTWRAYPPLQVGLWEFDSYLQATEGPPRLIESTEIDCQAARVRILYGEPRTSHDEETEESEDTHEAERVMIWATVGLTKDTVAI